MPLTFANPSLLFGALAAAVPIIIHLLSRRRIHRQPFSDLRFLEDVQAKQSRKIGIRSLLLLLLRVLAILSVVLAIARPQVGGLAPAADRPVPSCSFSTPAPVCRHSMTGEPVLPPLKLP